MMLKPVDAVNKFWIRYAQKSVLSGYKGAGRTSLRQRRGHLLSWRLCFARSTHKGGGSGRISTGTLDNTPNTVVITFQLESGTVRVLMQLGERDTLVHGGGGHYGGRVGGGYGTANAV